MTLLLKRKHRPSPSTMKNTEALLRRSPKLTRGVLTETDPVPS